MLKRSKEVLNMSEHNSDGEVDLEIDMDGNFYEQDEPLDLSEKEFSH
jgi:hypothetical protein